MRSHGGQQLPPFSTEPMPRMLLAFLMFLPLLGRSIYGSVLGVFRIISGRQLRRVMACHQAIRADQKVAFFRVSQTRDAATLDVVRQCLSAESEITVQLAASHFGASAC